MGFSQYKYNMEKLAKNLGITNDALMAAAADCKQGGFAKIWKIEDKGNYATAQITVSKKHNEGDFVVGTVSNGYDIQFQDSFVRLVGSAYKAVKGKEVPKGGLNIRISHCDSTNRYDKGKNTRFESRTIFALEVIDDNANQSKPQPKTAKQTKTPPVTQTGTTLNEDEPLPF